MTELPIDDNTLDEWLNDLDRKKARIRAQSKEVASYMESNEQFYEWFDELQGFAFREEYFWGDVERGDPEALFSWVRWSFHMGYLAGKNEEN